jgi:hypothetical protein
MTGPVPRSPRPKSGDCGGWVPADRPWDSITLVSSLTVLGRAAGTEHLPDRAAMRDTYRRLRELDDGLPPIEKTDLLSDTLWSAPRHRGAQEAAIRTVMLDLRCREKVMP